MDQIVKWCIISASVMTLACGGIYLQKNVYGFRVPFTNTVVVQK